MWGCADSCSRGWPGAGLAGWLGGWPAAVVHRVPWRLQHVQSRVGGHEAPRLLPVATEGLSCSGPAYYHQTSLCRPSLLLSGRRGLCTPARHHLQVQVHATSTGFLRTPSPFAPYNPPFTPTHNAQGSRRAWGARPLTSLMTEDIRGASPTRKTHPNVSPGRGTLRHEDIDGSSPGTRVQYCSTAFANLTYGTGRWPQPAAVKHHFAHSPRRTVLQRPLYVGE